MPMSYAAHPYLPRARRASRRRLHKTFRVDCLSGPVLAPPQAHVFTMLSQRGFHARRGVSYPRRASVLALPRRAPGGALLDARRGETCFLGARRGALSKTATGGLSQVIMTTLEEVYPEVAWRTYVVNAPVYLTVIWTAGRRAEAQCLA